MIAKRFSKQRTAIYKALSETKEHPTAEMLYSKLKQKYPKLSLGTVYRDLNQLTEDGQIIRLDMSVERYDACIKEHPHMKCEKCGNVYDIDLPYDKELDKLAEYEGHSINKHEIVFTGVCKKCREAE